MSSDMRPSLGSLPLLLPLLLTTFFAIAQADSYTAAGPPAPAPTVTFASPPPPTVTVASPPPPTLAFASPPPPRAPTVTVASQPPPPAFVSPPPPWAPTVTAPSPQPAPAWTPVENVNDKAIRQVGKFAVRIYAMSTRLQLVFVNVVGGQTQPCNGGYKYQLVIAVAGSGAKAARYDARVWGILGTTSWQLLSLTPK